MTTTADLQRVVFSHQWRELSEWARAVDALADLSDSEIEKLVRTAPCEQEAVPALA
ncbi:MAG: hypothetical protein JNM48_10545 [Rhodospirillales bacterium]|nr:hypothetical protein [Rhodospirillales bacterium]